MSSDNTSASTNQSTSRDPPPTYSSIHAPQLTAPHQGKPSNEHVESIVKVNNAIRQKRAESIPITAITTRSSDHAVDVNDGVHISDSTVSVPHPQERRQQDPPQTPSHETQIQPPVQEPDSTLRNRKNTAVNDHPVRRGPIVPSITPNDGGGGGSTPPASGRSTSTTPRCGSWLCVLIALLTSLSLLVGVYTVVSQQQLINDLLSDLQAVNSKLVGQQELINDHQTELQAVNSKLVSQQELINEHQSDFDRFQTDSTHFDFDAVFGQQPEFYLDESRSLNLATICDTIRKVRGVANLLSANAPIHGWNGHLLLNSNNIEIEGAMAFAKAVKMSKTLRHLDLTGNNIRDEGAKAIAEAVKMSQTLTHLRVDLNHLGDVGRAQIRTAWNARSDHLHL
eukprot:m.88456 g.88456  ORF g.88456 m.88456 type:complete len:395 (+) comp26199_c0_seq5:80-1264(+)